MEKKIVEASCKTILVNIDSHPLNWRIFPHRLVANAYVGCQRDRIYCYARCARFNTECMGKERYDAGIKTRHPDLVKSAIELFQQIWDERESMSLEDFIKKSKDMKARSHTI
jgi:DNA repair photolyase